MATGAPEVVSAGARRLRASVSASARARSRSSAGTLPIASDLLSAMAGSATIATAARTAAVALRFPIRVCRIHRRPFSTVNSTSQMSR